MKFKCKCKGSLGPGSMCGWSPRAAPDNCSIEWENEAEALECCEFVDVSSDDEQMIDI